MGDDAKTAQRIPWARYSSTGKTVRATESCWLSDRSEILRLYQLYRLPRTGTLERLTEASDDIN